MDEVVEVKAAAEEVESDRLLVVMLLVLMLMMGVKEGVGMMLDVI